MAIQLPCKLHTPSLGISTAIDIHGVYVYYSGGADAPDALHPAKAALNFGVGLYSLSTGPPGWGVEAIYFGIDNTIGWDNALNSYMEVEKIRLKCEKCKS